MPPTVATDLSARRFGRLTVLERAAGPDRKRAYWLCRCDCGQETVKMGKYLLCGDTMSCGCEQRAMRSGANGRRYGTDAITHRREYTIWRSMKSRCYVTSSGNYRFYGGRGVHVCDQWRKSFSVFLADMGPCPDGFTIDRINPSGHYEPGNCRWASWTEQHQNLRRHHAASSSSSS